MRTRQKRVATDTWRSLGCRTTPLEHSSRRKPTVEPRWAKQQTKFTKYVTNIIDEPKYKYGQQEQVTERNHNRGTAWNGQYKNTWVGAGGSLNRFYAIPTSPSASIMAQNIQLFGLREGFSNSSMDHHGKQINHR